MEKKALTKSTIVIVLTITLIASGIVSAGVLTVSSPSTLEGEKGETGETGPAGPQGFQGLKGDTGATGPAGSQGASGSTGPTGATGAKVQMGQHGIAEQEHQTQSQEPTAIST